MLSRLRSSAFARAVDRMVGSPLLWILGAMRPKRPFPDAFDRIGVLVFETIGDTLLASSVIASLRARYPRLQVVMYVSRGNAGVVPLIDGVDHVVEVPLTHPVRALAAVRRVPVDIAIDVGQWPRWYALLCAPSRSRSTVGFATRGQWRHHAYDHAIAHRNDVHELENFQRLLTAFPGARPVPPSAALKPVGAAPADIDASAPYVVVHPWASGFNFAAREWPTDRWAELIGRICAHGPSVLISGGPADRGRSADLAANCRAVRVRDISGCRPLAQVAAILRGAQAVVCVNTGIMHLAAILGVPVVALHGPTAIRRWGPTGSRSTALAPPPDIEAQFLNLGFEYPRHKVDCMSHISVDQVWAALKPHLEAK